MSLKPQPKLLILNQMAGPMTWELAEDLGHEFGLVALLTGHPDTLAKGSTASLQMYPAPIYQRGSFSRRAFSWLAYCLKAFFWLWQWPKEIPLLIFSNPPILCWLAWLLQILRGQHYAVMVHDIYPDVLVGLQGFSEGHWLIRAWRALNRRAYQNARVVMTLGEYMAANLEKQFDSTRTPAGKVEVIYPWVDTDKIRPISKEENWFAQKYNQVDKLTVMYSGNMGLGHDIETMLAAAQLLQDHPEIHFMFIGAGSKWNLVKKYKQQYALKNLTLLGWLPEEALPYSLACADVTLVSLEMGLEGLAIPSKAIYALSSGSPIIIMSTFDNEIQAWCKKFNLGILLPLKDNDGLMKSLISLSIDNEMLSAFKRASRNIAQQEFSRKVSAAEKFPFLLQKFLVNPINSKQSRELD